MLCIVFYTYLMIGEGKEKQEKVVRAIENKSIEQDARTAYRYEKYKQYVDSKNRRIDAELQELEMLEIIERQYEMTHELYDQYEVEKLNELDSLQESEVSTVIDTPVAKSTSD